ncbi:hypothetical protein ABKN59_011584 [Abortiporus biennis]
MCRYSLVLNSGMECIMIFFSQGFPVTGITLGISRQAIPLVLARIRPGGEVEDVLTATNLVQYATTPSTRPSSPVVAVLKRGFVASGTTFLTYISLPVILSFET